MEPEIQIRVEGSGYAAEGRGFYVWDPDRREVEETARELMRGNPRGSARRVVIRDGRTPALAGGHSEALDY